MSTDRYSPVALPRQPEIHEVHLASPGPFTTEDCAEESGQIDHELPGSFTR